ncbi:PREDICTED: putative nuclease HARBI1 [Theobroma cacao]|uniref:Nuclease HARBI1 n=1 Tax=Theobroma cacao TaxID=3641 RepID=A0AB32WT01_THECC|nr:PREDICTED: putative nuclease HARBI1 [Theobroma cacao]
MTALEAVAMFLWTYAHSETNHNVQNKFGKSRETVSRKFGEVLDSLCLLANENVKASDFQFVEVPSKIKNDRRYWPYVQGCIGAIDGSHVPAIPPVNDQIRFIGRKGYPTHKVMLVCNFDMLFTFVVVGWPGTAHDTRIFSTVLEEMKNVFPHPPEGKYYIVDASYPNMKGYLALYKGERYHIPDFRGCSQPEGIEETFNHEHSSLRNVIERTIRVWKNRWHILRDMKPFPLIKQEKIIVATMALHNYIRQCGVIDEEFDKCDRNSNYILESQEERSNDEEMGSYTSRRALDDSYMGRVRNQITTAFMENRNR